MVEELITNEEMCLDDFFNVFNNFTETLQDNLIPDSLLPPNATLFIREGVQHGKISSGTEYIVLLDTDFENWIYDFVNNTNTSYVRERTEYNTGNVEFQYTYKCHCSGKDKSQAEDCPQMIIKYKLHSNHTPGSDNDIGTLRLSKQIQNYIAQRMRDGLDVKAIEVIKEDQMLHEIEEESFNLWQHKLLENGDLTCAIAQSESNNNEDKGQLLGFIIPIMKEIIYNINTVLLDATHGLPLAHLISFRKNTASVQFWLYSLHIQLLWKGLISFLVDCDPAQIKALWNIFPKSKILLCWWHILRAWQDNLKKVYIKKANLVLNGKLSSEIKKKMKEELWDNLRELMYIDNYRNIDEYILNKWSNSISFISYFKKQWLNESNNYYQISEIDKTMWIKAYRLN
ncbi:20885_t:CDS:2, partial [Racocetra persica]